MNVPVNYQNSQSKSGFCMTLSEVASAVNAAMTGNDCMLNGISTDTRRIQGGELFIALRGPNFDANEFAEQAMQAGAAACLLEKENAGVNPSLIVADTHQALGQLASYWRDKFTLPLVAVTGSNGKTTVKEMLRSIFSQQGEVLATQGNLNNDIGVPLTLFRLDAKYKNAVVEMGANHAGEIAYLTGLARPSVALITNAASAHLEGFGSLEGVAKAKAEIYSGLGEKGVAIVNVDDTFAPEWIAGIKQHNAELEILTFGIENAADIQAVGIPTDMHGLTIYTPRGDFELKLPLLGHHNVMNALAATAAAIAVGVELDDIRVGLEMMQPVSGRLQRKVGINNSQIIDDTYNANPASMQAALEVLCQVSDQRILALGDMGELGNDEKLLHEQVGIHAHEAGVQRLFALGELATLAAERFGENAEVFDSHESMIARLRDLLGENVTLLVKGSRRMQMDKIVNALTEDGVVN